MRHPAESRCPSCAATYRADAYQLLAAGLKGGKGVPESVAEHPRLFVTFTAPSFGRVHARKAQGRLVLSCHPTGRVPAAPTACGMGAGTAMTRTIPAWASRCARPAMTLRRRCSGTPWPRNMFGLPDHGPSPVRLLVESHGLTLDQLHAAVLEELDQTR